MDTKVCRICGHDKPLSDYHIKTAAKDGHQSACKPCANAESLASLGKYRKRRGKAVRSGFKICVACKRERKIVVSFGRNKHTHDGFHHTCKACMQARARARPKPKDTSSRRHYMRDPARARDRRLSKQYGVPIGWYAAMLAAQDGGCAICGRDSSPGKFRLAIDHCHETKAVRGLLCTFCNQAIGQLQHSPALLRRAAEYLENPPHLQLRTDRDRFGRQTAGA